MENVLLLTITIAVLFIVAKITEMRFIENELKPLKTVVRDAFIVAGCAFVPIWGYFHFKDNISDWFGIPAAGGTGAMPSKNPRNFHRYSRILDRQGVLKIHKIHRFMYFYSRILCFRNDINVHEVFDRFRRFIFETKLTEKRGISVGLGGCVHGHFAQSFYTA
jgi:hypothetical protein